MRTATAILSLLLAAVVCPEALGQPERWLVPEAAVRRTVTCRPAKTSLPGDDVAVVTFFTGGKAARGGKDIRVFAVGGQVRPVAHRVLMTGPGDRLRVAFATPRGASKYHVYYGNPKAAAPGRKLRIRRGLLYEVRRGEAANVRRVEQIERAFSRAVPQGTAMVDSIFFGFNPFGPSEGFISRFTGYLDIRESGQYRIATTSDDCSFVVIDDKLVVKWGGTHNAVADARHNAPIYLERGLHKIIYWHAQGGGGTVAEAAWLRPGQKRYRVIPKGAFAPVAIAELGEVQFRGRRISPDFYATRAGEVFCKNFYSVRVEFENRTVPAGNPDIEYHWDFGDGQASTRISPGHVYLRHGTFKVRLTVTWGPQKAELTNRVVVQRNWWMQSLNKVEGRHGYAKLIAGYDLAKLDAVSLSHAIDLFAEAEEGEHHQRALESLVFKVAGASDKEMLKRTAELVTLYRGKGRYDHAIRAYRRAESRLSGASPKAEMALAAAGMMLEDRSKMAEAEKEFRRVLKNRAGVSGLLLREAHIGLGDVACRRGDAEAARKAFSIAEKTPGGWQARKNPLLRASSLARYVEEYIRTRDLEAAQEYLRTWYREFPSQRLGGHAPLLEARLMIAMKQYRRAVQVVEQLFALNPECTFMPQVLLVGVEANMQLNSRDEARKMLALIVDDYPESGRHKEAVDMLKKLGGHPDSSVPE